MMILRIQSQTKLELLPSCLRVGRSYAIASKISVKCWIRIPILRELLYKMPRSYDKHHRWIGQPSRIYLLYVCMPNTLRQIINESIDWGGVRLWTAYAQLAREEPVKQPKGGAKKGSWHGSLLPIQPHHQLALLRGVALTRWWSRMESQAWAGTQIMSLVGKLPQH